MNRQHTRFRAMTLPATVGIGLLTLSLAACGGSGDEGESSAPASSDAANEASVSATPSATEDATAGASATASPDASSSDDAAAAGDVEAALTAVLGDETTILTGEQLEQATQESQGLTENMTVTPEECFDAGQAASGDLGEGVENIGGLTMDLSDATMPSTDILMVTTFPSAEAAAQSLEATQTQSEDCSQFTVEVGDAMSMEMSLEVQPVEVVEAGGSFAMTSTTTVALSGASLPPGAESTTATTVVVQDDDRLITYSGTGGGDGVVPVEDGVTLVEDLRAELDG